MTRSSSGVTLLELLIVVMLMALIAAVTIPIFGPGVSTTELRSAARQVAAGLRLARGQAIAQRTEAMLVVDVATRTFIVPPDARVHALPSGIDLKLFTAQRDLVSPGRRGDVERGDAIAPGDISFPGLDLLGRQIFVGISPRIELLLPLHLWIPG